MSTQTAAPGVKHNRSETIEPRCATRDSAAANPNGGERRESHEEAAISRYRSELRAKPSRASMRDKPERARPAVVRLKPTTYADLGTYWGHASDLSQTQKRESPAMAGLFRWAVEDSNLQPWD